MKWWTILLAGAAMASGELRCAETACPQAEVEASVEVHSGELTLADLLAPGACAQLREFAARVNLGFAPLMGGVRVLDGGAIARLIKGIASGLALPPRFWEKIPDRIVVRRTGARKSCAEISRLLLESFSQTGIPQASLFDFDCASAQSIPEDTVLDLAKTRWNPALRRWEFVLRCTGDEHCVPFLVWAREESIHAAELAGSYSDGALFSLASAETALAAANSGGELLVKPGQTATLRWNGSGVLIVLPVTCLDGGGAGQTVRVRFKNTERIVRAEVLRDGTLQASL
jgi:hypothetical protein